MINLQKLRYLSSICAYCNKVLSMSERTNDHIIPRSAGGKTETKNIVVCCNGCNSLKGSSLINDFLEKYPKKVKCLSNYLNMIDYQMGNNEYSSAISEVLSESSKMLLSKEKPASKNLKPKQKQKQNKSTPTSQKQINEVQNIEYKYESSNNSFYISELQAKILDYYLANPEYSNFKELAKNLNISNEKLISEIICINNLTGIFKIKQMSKNGIVLNNLQGNNFYQNIHKV